MAEQVLEAAVVVLFGGMVGIGELLSRFPANPSEAIKTKSSWLYVAVNALAAVTAFVIINLQSWTFGASGAVTIQLTQVLVAGFGAMALFRASLFTVKIGDSNVAIGPLAFLQVLLDTAERSVQRQLATDMNDDALRWLRDVPYGKAKTTLPLLCAQLDDTVSDSSLALVNRTIVSIDQAQDVSDPLKALELGLVLIRVYGDQTMLAAVKDLRQDLALPPITPSSVWLRVRPGRRPASGASGPSTMTPPTGTT
jgi:hypothetical protein